MKLVVGVPWWVALPIWALQLIAWIAVLLGAVLVGAVVFVVTVAKELAS